MGSALGGSTQSGFIHQLHQPLHPLVPPAGSQPLAHGGRQASGCGEEAPRRVLCRWGFGNQGDFQLNHPPNFLGVDPGPMGVPAPLQCWLAPALPLHG